MKAPGDIHLGNVGSSHGLLAGAGCRNGGSKLLRFGSESEQRKCEQSFWAPQDGGKEDGTVKRHVVRGMAKSLVCVAAVLLCLSTAHAAPTAIDGNIADWNVTLTTSSAGLVTTFDQNSLIPNREGAISYVVDDYLPGSYVNQLPGGEPDDFEAVYLDYDPSNLYIGVISSHLWRGESQIHVTVEIGGALAAEYYQRGDQQGNGASDFNAFAEADLGVDEMLMGWAFPNYFWEGSIACSLGQFQEWTVSVWVSQYYNGDAIFVDQAGGGNDVPEPASVLLVGIGVMVAGGGSWLRRKTRVGSK